MMMKTHSQTGRTDSRSAAGAPGSGHPGRGERFERIMAALRVGSSVHVADLAARFGISTETVRRDLDELSRRGLVDRTYGGAAAPVPLDELATDAVPPPRLRDALSAAGVAAHLAGDID